MKSIVIKKAHAGIFPKNIFMIMAGATGSGKTNLLISLLLDKLLAYDRVMIYTTTQHQNGYRYLKDCDENDDIVTFHDPHEGIVDPSGLDKNKTFIVVFDDVMNECQKPMIDYFTRGRHNGCNVFYLCQSLHQIKKHSIRQNANVFILFHQDDKTLKYFYDTHLSSDMPFPEFKKWCADVWSTNHGYVVINLFEEPSCGRYISNYNELYIPEKFIKCHKMS